MPKSKLPAGSPLSITVQHDGEVAILRLNRPHKRNALADDMVAEIDAYFSSVPETVRAIVIAGTGGHFCAGLDLSELKDRDAVQGMHHSRSWHRVFEKIQFGRVPVVAVLEGAVIGGGLELACAAHIRVAEPSAFYALPEGQRGIFVGGGGSARLPKLIGVPRMADMMLTGRVYKADEGERLGFAQYLVAAGEGMNKGMELARRIAANAGMTNYAVMHALPRIAESSQDDGLFTESLIAAIAQSAPEAKARMRAFLDGKAAKVKAS